MKKAEKTRNLRCKRPALADLGFEIITSRLEEMQSQCYDIHWAFDDDETLLNALDGNEEEAWEFKMMFIDLEGQIDRLLEAMDSNFIYDGSPETDFNDMSVALIGNRYNLIGYDYDEEDYFNLTGYDSDLAFSKAGERVMRMTKKEMLAQIGQTLGLILSFQNISMMYEALKSTIDIFQDNNVSILQVIKDIESAYTAMFEGNAYESLGCLYLDREAEKRFDKILEELPEKFFIE